MLQEPRQAGVNGVLRHGILVSQPAEAPGRAGQENWGAEVRAPPWEKPAPMGTQEGALQKGVKF